MATSHTPGPWLVGPWGRVGFEVQGAGRSLAIVNKVQERWNVQQEQHPMRGVIGVQEPDYDGVEAAANARLMAAAPALLTALTDLLEFWDHGTPVHPGADVVEAARAAVTKATEER